MGITVDGNRLDAQMVRETGAIGDYFTLIKNGLGPPAVHAGTDQTIRLPVDTVNLDGTVLDDGLPDPPGMVTTLWTAESGPGPVIFGDASAVDTTATFSIDGIYVLRLTADDGQFVTYDELTVTVLPIQYRGDFDHDLDVDQKDFGHLQACFSGGGSIDGNRLDADLNSSGQVDQFDSTIFQGCLSGSGNSPALSCAE